MSFLARLQAQPWYSDVAAEFASIAPDVPSAVWQGEILSEDSSLDPTQQDYLHSGHFGLFQEDAQFPTTVGLPAATVQQLQDPRYNAYVAAMRMEQALKQTGASTFPTQIEALEQAGWPGAISSSETATRLQNVDQVAAEEGGSTTTGYGWSGPWWAFWDPKAWGGGNATTDQIAAGESNAESALPSIASKIGESLFVGGLIVAFITGGFVLLAASVNKGGTPMPVPVPV